MLKRSKIAVFVATAVVGTLHHSCSVGGLGGFADGFLKKGFIDNWWIDGITDWWKEDVLYWPW